MLARVTCWSSDSTLYGKGAVRAAPLWDAWWRTQLSWAPAFDARATYAALALVHALLARIRLTPVIPDDAGDRDPFVVALRRIEQESGRMVQAQIRLLKLPVPFGRTEAERVETQQVAVDAAFQRFLEWLANDRPSEMTTGKPASVSATPSGVVPDVGAWLMEIMARAARADHQEPISHVRSASSQATDGPQANGGLAQR
jgi:hypothetical protein